MARIEMLLLRETCGFIRLSLRQMMHTLWCSEASSAAVFNRPPLAPQSSILSTTYWESAGQDIGQLRRPSTTLSTRIKKAEQSLHSPHLLVENIPWPAASLFAMLPIIPIISDKKEPLSAHPSWPSELANPISFRTGSYASNKEGGLCII